MIFASLLTAVVFLLVLSALVLIHEAGHYFVAKRLGIKVEEFGFGLPLFPAIFSFKRGETVYSIYPALIGGFVKLYGEDEAGAGRVELKVKSAKLKVDEQRAFFSRPVWQRAAVVVAGVVMNFFLAAAIYYVFFGLANFRIELPRVNRDYNFSFVDQHTRSDVYIGDVAKNSPAAKAGLTAASRIVSINGEKVTSTEFFLEIVKAHKGKPIVLEWQNLETSKISRATLTPRANPPKNEGALGVVFSPVEMYVLTYNSWDQRLLSGITFPVGFMGYTLEVMKGLIDASVAKRDIAPVSQAVSGPVMIYTVVGKVLEIPDLKEKVMQILNLAGALSISLAFFNVLPIPGLDGGRLFFIIIEGVFGWKLNQKTEGYINAVGMAFLLTLIVLITYKDIVQLLVK